MSSPVISNPIINSPFAEPRRHFRFDEAGITADIAAGRRPSGCFVPVARAARNGGKLPLPDSEWTRDRLEENRLVNRIRARVAAWREGGYRGVTPTTARLLAYWIAPERDQRLFFCQLEALETAIYIAEVAGKLGDGWIENELRAASEAANPGLPRIALKLATGSGKTVVMAMLITWHALNKLANPRDARFSDAFLIVTPGITIRDRLRVLLPNDPDNYYRRYDIVAAAEREQLGRAKIVITNFHAFLRRETMSAGRLTKTILAAGQVDLFAEAPSQMVRRACRSLGNKRNIVVINDEAHHCYRGKPTGDVGERLTGEERAAARERDEAARVWISGIEAVQAKIGVRAIYDLSATPFFLSGSGYREGTLFPWVVSDFSLIDAIEAGVVKVPRLPAADVSNAGDRPTHRDLWPRIRDELPRKCRAAGEVDGNAKLPAELLDALHQLYRSYERCYRLWQRTVNRLDSMVTPPVFIVVCNNTAVSKLVFDYVAGWESLTGNASTVEPGQLPIFRNDDGRGGWLARPNTILIDSRQLESGRGMSREFKQIAAREIADFKNEYRARFPGRDADRLTDEDVLREVLNTVGRRGKLGEHVKCVVSVAMLSEGWDASTVTHVLGVRAFGTQLLCEQVVGRALRRLSYAPDSAGMLQPEFAEVCGVPFSFMPCAGSPSEPQPNVVPTRVRALDERRNREITFPRLIGYRYDSDGEHLDFKFTEDSRLTLTAADIPASIESAPLVGGAGIRSLDDLKRRRSNEVAFQLARLTLEKYLCRQVLPPPDRKPASPADGAVQPWRFPHLVAIVKRWLSECVTIHDQAFTQLLLLLTQAHAAADRIFASISATTSGSPVLHPILRPRCPCGSTRGIDFDTTRSVYATRADKCHVSHVVAEAASPARKLAQSLEEMDEVVRYVNNRRLGLTIPYIFRGEAKEYAPDFIACIDDGHGDNDLLNVLIDLAGAMRVEERARVAVRTLWLPAVNHHGSFGRWDFVEADGRAGAAVAIRAHVCDR